MRTHPLLLVMAACCLAMAACGGGSGAQDPPPPMASHDLVFDGENADGTRHLYRVALDGTAPLRLGAGISGVRPQPRADGKALVYFSFPTDTEPAALMLVDDFNQPPVALSTIAGVPQIEPTWSPDGTRIIYTSLLDDPGGDIFVGSIEDRRLTQPRNLTPRTPEQQQQGFIDPDRTPSWSPDGTQIAFTAYRAGTPTIWVMNADGSNPRQVTQAGNYGDYYPSWSPDGRMLAFHRTDIVTARVGVVAVNGATPPEFFAFAGKAYAPAWSPDGSRIAFVGDAADELDIYVFTTRGQPVLRVQRAGADRNPAWIRR